MRRHKGVYISAMGHVVVFYTRADRFSMTPKFIANVQKWVYRGAGRIGSEALHLMGKSGAGRVTKLRLKTGALIK